MLSAVQHLVLPTLVLAVSAGCGEPQLTPTAGDLVPERAVSPRALLEDWRADGAWMVSEPLATPEGATQVGLLLEVRGENPELMARATDGSWQQAAYTFHDGAQRVAKIPLQKLAGSVELRVRRTDIARIDTLLWSAVIPEAPTSTSTRSSVDLGVTQRALEIEGVQPRSAWGARATQCTSLNASKSRISIHHTVTPSTPSPDYAARLRGIQAYHMDTRNWCDVGYHFLVTVDGTAWEAREARFIGAHVGGQNAGNLGISLVGCFHTSGCADFPPNQPPQAILDAATQLVATNAAHYGIDISSSTVMGHRDNPGQSTSCPGDNLHDRLDEIRGGASDVEPSDPTGRVQGVVFDLSRAPSAADSDDARLGHANVTCDCGVTQTVREDDAFWAVDLPPGQWTLTTSATGFADSVQTVDVGVGDTVWASVGLAPTVSAVSLEVRVLDQSTGLAIENATVTAFAGADETVVASDSEGIARFGLPVGTIELRATAEGYREGIVTEFFETPNATAILRLVAATVPPPPDEEEVEVPVEEEPQQPVPTGPPASPELDTANLDVAQKCECISGDGDASEPMVAVLILFGLGAALRRRR